MCVCVCVCVAGGKVDSIAIPMQTLKRIEFDKQPPKIRRQGWSRRIAMLQQSTAMGELCCQREPIQFLHNAAPTPDTDSIHAHEHVVHCTATRLKCADVDCLCDTVCHWAQLTASSSWLKARNGQLPDFLEGYVKHQRGVTRDFRPGSSFAIT